MVPDKFRLEDAPVLIVMGQSNAHGHGTKIQLEEEKSLIFQDVFGLSRTYNQSYDIEDVKWSPFAMRGMNLGENQEDTYCLGGEFARLWQEKINRGKQLPPLYVIQISIGSQGIDEEEQDGLNMWWRDRAPVLTPGALGQVDISLYPLARHILSLAMQNLRNQGKNPLILGLHWNQWETEVFSGGEVVVRARENYKKLFQGFYEALGGVCTTYLYKPISLVHDNEPGRKHMVALFEEFEAEYEYIRIVDPKESPLWNCNREDKGIFQQDLVHYSGETQKWFASYQYDEVFGKNILVLGDSITADGRYIEYLNAYFKKHRPKDRVHFINGGLSSENTSGLTENVHPGPRPCIFDRLEQVLDTTDAKRVLVCYGMNDGIYHPFSEERFLLYQKGIRKLVSILEKAGKEVYLMTPAPFDPPSFEGPLIGKDGEDFGYLNPYEKYDNVLKLYADWLLKEYGEKGYTVIDLHRKLEEERAGRRIVDQEYISGDGIHPNEDGHRVIMQAIMDGLFHTTLTWAAVEDTEHEGIWEGFKTDYFLFRGYEVTVAKPSGKENHGGWVYRTEFFGAFPSADIEMLKRGYYVVNLKLCNRYGDSGAADIMEAFRRMIVERYHVTEKPILFGFSRGGLYALHYTAAYGENVHKLYLDAPVVNLLSWPAKLEKGVSLEWQECRRIWHLFQNSESYLVQMQRALKCLIEFKIPLVLVYGSADDVVPYEENGMLLTEQYSVSEIPFLLIEKPGCGHHPHSLDEPKEIIRFLLQ